MCDRGAGRKLGLRSLLSDNAVTLEIEKAFVVGATRMGSCCATGTELAANSRLCQSRSAMYA